MSSMPVNAYNPGLDQNKQPAPTERPKTPTKTLPLNPFEAAKNSKYDKHSMALDI